MNWITLLTSNRVIRKLESDIPKLSKSLTRKTYLLDKKNHAVMQNSQMEIPIIEPKVASAYLVKPNTNKGSIPYIGGNVRNGNESTNKRNVNNTEKFFYEGQNKADYSSIRAYEGVDVELIPIEYRTDPRLIAEMEFKGSGMSGTNAAGWERNAGKYFGDSLENHPEYWSEVNAERIENGMVPIVDEHFAKHFPQYKKQIGDKIIHHHIGGGGQAVGVPESLHRGFGGIHNYEKEFGIRGNDPAPDLPMQDTTD